MRATIVAEQMSLEAVNHIFRKQLGIDPSSYVVIRDDPDTMRIALEKGPVMSFSRYFYKFLDRKKVVLLGEQKQVIKEYPSSGLAFGYMRSIIAGKLEDDEGGCVFEHEALILPFKYVVDKQSDVPEKEQLERQLYDIVMSEEVIPWQTPSSMRFSKANITYKYMFLHHESLSREYLDAVRSQL